VGRLFWKFFAFIWLAQLGGIIAISAAFWLTERHADRTLDIASGPAAGTQIEAAAAARCGAQCRRHDLGLVEPQGLPPRRDCH